MRSHLRALTDRLSFYEWAYGRMAEADSDLGPIAEYLVGSALDCLPDSRRVLAPYDLILPDGRTVEVKATAKRATQSGGRPPIYRWKVATQFSDPNKKLADLWFFLVADFPALARRRLDVFDPKYWTVRVVTGPEIATTGVSRYVTETTLSRLGAPRQPFNEIKKGHLFKPVETADDKS